MKANPGGESAMQFAQRMERLGTESAFEVMARAKHLEAQGQSIIHLEIGQPDFPTAPHICDAAYKAMKEGYTGYAPAAGLPVLREAIAQHISTTRQVQVSPENVVVMPGAKPVIFFTLLALAGPGDEIIYPDPGFPIYESVINFVNATPVPLPLRESVGFRFQVEDLEARVSDKTKLLILNSPQNPTGGALTIKDLEAIARLAHQYDVMILADEIYSRMLYEGEFCSIASLPNMMERTVILDGHSKTYAMTGWRLGYAIAPFPLAQKLEQLMINSNSATCSFTQMAGVTALTGDQEFVSQMVDQFRHRRDAIVAGLNDIAGVSCLTPAGAFYAFPNVSELAMDDRAIAHLLLEEAGVAVLPGSSFGNCGKGYLRLSYANSLENIQEALKRMQVKLAELS